MQSDPQDIVPVISQAFEQLAIPTCESGTLNLNIQITNQHMHNEAKTFEIKNCSGFQITQGQEDLNPSHASNLVNQQPIPKSISVQPQESSLQQPPSAGCIKETIAKVKQALRNNSEPDLVLSKLDVSSDEIPEVYPELFCVEFYEGRAVPEDEKYHPTHDKKVTIKSDRKVTFDELVSETDKYSFISIIGYPGSGKTTLSKRLMKQFSKIDGSIAFRLKFMDLNDFEDTAVSLKELLLGDDNLDLSEIDKTLVFNYIRQQPDKCYVIIDGFDQVNWDIKEKVPPVKHDVPANIQNLVSSLCKGKLLNRCHLIFTSRPHAMLEIPKRCRPQSTYFIRDLLFDDMKRLFDALIANERRSFALWEALTTKAPQLASMCHNPLMLQLYVRATIGSIDVGYVTSMTRVFHTVLQNLMASDHTVALNDAIIMSLARLAYKATKSGTVMISLEDLQSEHLISEQVQDLVITLLGSNQKCGLVEGKKRLYFTHQTFQEYFAAYHICSQIPLKEFEEFLQHDLLTDHWSVVSQFLAGLVLDPDMRKGINEVDKKTIKPISLSTFKQMSLNLFPKTQLSALDSCPTDAFLSVAQGLSPIDHATAVISYAGKEKKELLVGKLTEEIVKKTGTFEALDIRLQRLRIYRMLRESNDVKVTQKIARCFPGRSFNMGGVSLTHSDAHALACVLKYIPTRIEDMAFNNCHLNAGSFRYISSAIQEMPGSIEKLNLTNNRLSNISSITSLLPKIEKILFMWACFEDLQEKGRMTGASPTTILDINHSIATFEKKLIICVSGDERLQYKK